MAETNNGGFKALAVVAFIAFLAGRASVGDPPAPAVQPESLFSDTFPAPDADTAIGSTATARPESETAAKVVTVAEPVRVVPVPVVTQRTPREPVRFAEPVNDGPTYFANCSHARSLGAAPVRSGDPGYSRKLDRDGDGIGCE